MLTTTIRTKRLYVLSGLESFVLRRSNMIDLCLLSERRFNCEQFHAIFH